MIKIKNLSEAVRKQIRLIPAEGATSDITGSTGAIAKDGEDILICLSPMVPPVVADGRLAIVPVTQAQAMKAYYSKGVTPASAENNIFHDKPTETFYDVIGFGDGTVSPTYFNPSDEFVDFTIEEQWPNVSGYIANDLREIRMTPTWHVVFPAELIANVRTIAATDPTRVILTENWVDVNNHDNNYEMSVTAAEFIGFVDNSLYGFFFGDNDNPAELTLTFNLGGGAPSATFKIKPTANRVKRWTPNLITLNTGINIPGLFAGVDGFGFIEFESEIPRLEDGTNDGGGGAYQVVKANGTGTQVTLGGRDSIEAWVSPSGDGYIKAKMDGVNNVQFSLLTETDMDLSDRGLGIPGLTCHYMKTTVPEHKLFHHRFFFTYTTVDEIACTPSSPVTLVNNKLDIAQGDVIRIAGRLETVSGTQVLTGTYTVDSQLLALNALYAEDINWFNMGAKFYPTGTGDKDTMISPVLASDYPPDWVWHADPRTITYDTCANLGVTLQAGELDFVRDILQVTEPVVIHTCGYVTSS